jgi:hypothetical protein
MVLCQNLRFFFLYSFKFDAQVCADSDNNDDGNGDDDDDADEVAVKRQEVRNEMGFSEAESSGSDRAGILANARHKAGRFFMANRQARRKKVRD